MSAAERISPRVRTRTAAINVKIFIPFPTRLPFHRLADKNPPRVDLLFATAFRLKYSLHLHPAIPRTGMISAAKKNETNRQRQRARSEKQRVDVTYFRKMITSLKCIHLVAGKMKSGRLKYPTAAASSTESPIRINCARPARSS